MGRNIATHDPTDSFNVAIHFRILCMQVRRTFQSIPPIRLCTCCMISYVFLYFSRSMQMYGIHSSGGCLYAPWLPALRRNDYRISRRFPPFFPPFHTYTAQEAGVVTATDNRGWSALVYAVASGRTAIVDAMVSLVERSVPPEQVCMFHCCVADAFFLIPSPYDFSKSTERLQKPPWPSRFFASSMYSLDMLWHCDEIDIAAPRCD